MQDEKPWLFKKGERLGINHPKWKGDNATYGSIHDWIDRNYGKARKCENCGTLTAKRYEWTNIDHKYLREIKYWRQMCSSCHKKYDWKMTGRVAYNKDKPLGFIPIMAFKKGHKQSVNWYNKVVGGVGWSRGLTKETNPVLARPNNKINIYKALLKRKERGENIKQETLDKLNVDISNN